MTITAAAHTDIGRVRKNNQDSFGIDDEAQVFVVCDGMGGAAGGEIASRIAVDTFLASFRSTETVNRAEDTELQRSAHALYQAAVDANGAVVARAAAEPALKGMGSTLVGAHIEGERWQLVNVGDSRAYLIRNEVCTQLTIDHSFLEEQIRMGFMTREAAAKSPLQSVITRAVGIQEGFEPDLSDVGVEDGDVVLLTSDGLTRYLDEAAIAGIVRGETASLEERCVALVERAKDGGGSDNITCILLRASLS